MKTRIMRGNQPIIVFQGQIYRRATIQEIERTTATAAINYDEEPIRLPSLFTNEFRVELFWTYRRMNGQLIANVTKVRVKGGITNCRSKHGRSLYVIDGDVEDIEAEIYVDEIGDEEYEE